MDWEKALEILKAQYHRYKRSSKKLERNTYLEEIDGHSIGIRLHGTYVVTFHKDGSIKLDSGGWRTVTTKDRIRRYLPRPWSVEQDHGQWFLTNLHYVEGPPIGHNGATGQGDYHFEGGRVALFEDGMVIKPDGTVKGGVPVGQYKERLKLRQQAQRYAGKYVRAMEAGKVRAPLPSDPALRITEEAIRGQWPGHEAFPPRLMLDALESGLPVAPAMRWAVAEKWDNLPKQAEGHFWFPTVRPMLQKLLSKYLVRELGQAG